MGLKEKDLFNAKKKKKKNSQRSVNVHSTFVPDYSRVMLPTAFRAIEETV